MSSLSIISPNFLLARPAQPRVTAFARLASSASSRWKQRQGRDAYARDARLQGLKSRAAFKLLEVRLRYIHPYFLDVVLTTLPRGKMDAKYKFFKSGQTVVDLGYAPGSWSQVAMERTRPAGRVIGIDLIPAQPPRGVATFQGDFLSPAVQHMVKKFIAESHRLRPPPPRRKPSSDTDDPEASVTAEDESEALNRPSYIEMERQSSQIDDESAADTAALTQVDDLCNAALQFASDTLRPGGHFVCKFYQGSEDRALEQKLKTLFAKVSREKPEASRSESKEAYLIGLRRKKDVVIEED
ncbi:hypothetical protein S7711_06766 [Stachybotrys chartarum IBT 7711]|uniref:rRNA methyltransferase 2, mitochondrial n=1 Tax=Stachybotrys chartarum (strain CBS 109288 / IBT 7711) TaxID=1280523 RepID=A0A084AN39_STACB|nr:hypothetical protein S7711_06766 [Stachybotrys chartarum IBT 7711]KFA47207.1 hypothetical protein S40293_06697 [Stachybotrys chartarum IBT 40293]KFA70731.1 hypothetical protein S40288_08883 [Stachybotrys chartarum IBT 40288]